MRTFFRTLALLTAGLTTLAYAAVLVPPAQFWPAAFVTLTIPFWLMAHIGLLLWGLRLRTGWAVVPLLWLAMGWRFWQATIGLGGGEPGSPDFSVLSYNVHVFSLYEYPRGERPLSVHQLVQWLADHPADVLCLQEFYYEAKGGFNPLRTLEEAGWHTYFAPWSVDKAGRSFGMAVLSRHPLGAQGVLATSKRQNNQVIFADVQLPGGTVRFYNVHLQSLSLDADERRLGLGSDTARQVSRRVAQKMRRSYEQRNHQLAQLEEDLNLCPHPSLVCGDLNDLPYSYAYYRLSRYMRNAFEAAGWGLGFTYRGSLPFLRIDHQFADPELVIHDFRTLRSVTQSDHYPIWGKYSFAKARAVP